MNTIDDSKQKAQDFILKLAAGDYPAAYRLFDNTLAQALPEAQMKEFWLQMVDKVGQLQKITDCQATEIAGTTNAVVTCQFEKQSLDFILRFNQSGEMSTFTYQPTPGANPYHAPAYVNPAAFHEVEVTVGSGEWALPGTLSLPDVAGQRLPAVVLVHGSGPNDRDETLGPNRPFRDLAWGLASQGIAVLRYEKRTKAHASKFTPEVIAKLTDQEEVIDDALAAVVLLRQRPEIDPQRIYVLGHSLGATLAPRIGQQDPALAGLIVMGAITRPLEDTILDQFTYLYGLSGSISDAQKAELEQLKAKVARVKDPNLSEQVPAADLPLNITPAYWLSLRGYHPNEVAKTLSMRIFVMQGGRDYQVTAADDFPGWQKSLEGKSGANLKLYPKLYHLFIPGEGPSTPQEYMVEGHVSEEAVQDIAGWIINK